MVTDNWAVSQDHTIALREVTSVHVTLSETPWTYAALFGLFICGQ